MGIIEKDDYKLIHGRGVGNQLSEAINQAEKKIWIITPWISKKYAKQLVKKHDDDVDVNLLTTNDTGNSAQKKSLDYLIETWKEEKGTDYTWLRQLSGATFIFTAALTLLTQSAALSILPMISLIGLGAGYALDDHRHVTKVQKNLPFHMFNSEYHSNSSLTHSKIYILDDQVFVGSANFTEHGLWQNIEVLFQFQDEDLKDKTHEIFDNIIESVETEKVDVKDVAADIKENL